MNVAAVKRTPRRPEYSIGEATGVPLRSRREVLLDSKVLDHGEWFETFTMVVAGSALHATEKGSGIIRFAAYGAHVLKPLLKGWPRDRSVVMYAHRTRWGQVGAHMHGAAAANPHRGPCAPFMVGQTRRPRRSIMGWRCMAIRKRRTRDPLGRSVRKNVDAAKRPSDDRREKQALSNDRDHVGD